LEVLSTPKYVCSLDRDTNVENCKITVDNLGKWMDFQICKILVLVHLIMIEKVKKNLDSRILLSETHEDLFFPEFISFGKGKGIGKRVKGPL
jgi:hypothetical protein